VVEAISISKSFGDLKVLNDVTIKVNRAEIISVVGASGAGKTTLLQILGTLDQADEGMVKIGGVVVSELEGNQLADFRNKNIGFVFQFHHLLPEFTALENVALPALIGGVERKKAFKDATELLDYLGMNGEQQRVAVARALVNHPKVVFADEPSGNLDSENARELHELFFKLRSEFYQTFVIVTHNEELANLADSKFVMKDGSIQNIIKLPGTK
jgi:lipoprotein-releasing system ATP-binding protein